jgi:hypothetical protein
MVTIEPGAMACRCRCIVGERGCERKEGTGPKALHVHVLEPHKRQFIAINDLSIMEKEEPALAEKTTFCQQTQLAKQSEGRGKYIFDICDVDNKIMTVSV